MKLDWLFCSGPHIFLVGSVIHPLLT